MASHARSTRTPLLRLSRSPEVLLGQGLGRQLGPVTQAIRAMRTATSNVGLFDIAPHGGVPDHCTPRVQSSADQAIADIQEGLACFFSETGIPVTAAELRRRIEDRIEADLELLEALDGDADREADYTTCEHHPDGGLCTLGRSTDDEETLCGIGTHPGGSSNLWPSHDEREAGDDNGIADWGGEFDQTQRFLAMGGDLNEYVRRFA